MTNQDAINIINSLKQYYNDKNEDSYVGLDDEDNEALDLAIKALEQQSCDEEDTNCTECRYYDKEKHYCPRFCRVIKDTMAEITSEQGKWISVSERLPEEGQKVLITDKFEAVTTAMYFQKSPFWKEMVVAWQPLPESYKESDVN